MPGLVCRLGDKNSAGGVIIVGDTTVLVNNRPVSVLGSSVSPHGPAIHSASRATSTNPTVIVNGIPITTLGDIDICGHPRIEGSPNVIVGR